MSVEPQVSRSDLRWWATAIVIPGIGLLLSMVILGTKVLDRIDNISQDIQVVKDDLKGVHSDLNGVHSTIDTINSRQLRYHYENQIYRAKHDK